MCEETEVQRSNELFPVFFFFSANKYQDLGLNPGLLHDNTVVFSSDFPASH